jgi:hypothetical protein
MSPDIRLHLMVTTGDQIPFFLKDSIFRDKLFKRKKLHLIPQIYEFSFYQNPLKRRINSILMNFSL